MDPDFFFLLFLDLYLHVCHALHAMEQNIPSLIMCLTYMNCMTFDNKQFTDLKKKLVFVVQKYIIHVVVLHYKSI